ncbi:MAG TPA: efflux RND transporter periplasmic adaptor subunit [Desulfurivibrionaceae bacterium]|nr:efflux RND transporter periplasmic adaptor subunit [Desulfurivibrionaceae bacterium]
MKSKTGIALVLGLAALAAGCSKNGGANPQTVSKPAVAVETAIAAAGELLDEIEVTGNLEPKFFADVKTQIPGLVKQVFVTEWVRVRKGQPLARIDVAETEALAKRAEAGVAGARATLAQAQVTLARAEREEARTLKLKETGLATQQAVDESQTETAAARARITAVRAQIAAAEEEVRQVRARLQKGLVTAPLDGVVALRAVNVGDLASDAAAGAPIFKIVDNRLLNLTVTVPSAAAARVKVGQPLTFTVDSLPGQTFSGRVMFVNPELSAADRSLKVIAEVRNDGDRLKGGLFAKGRIVTGKRGGVVQVPRSALSGWDVAKGSAKLFMAAGDVARQRPVTTGTVSGDQVEIASGLKVGEQYVVRGGFTLKDGDKIVTSTTKN